MKPLHEHDCKVCKFVGEDVPLPGEPRVNRVDMYVHGTKLIRRYSSEPGDYGCFDSRDGRIPKRYQGVAKAGGLL